MTEPIPGRSVASISEPVDVVIDTSTLKPEEKQYLDEHSLKKPMGTIHIWSLGVGAVITGEYFGWNGGLGVAGPIGMLIASLFVCVLYMAWVLALSELSVAMPFAGGPLAYGIVNPAAVSVHTFKGNGGATWKIYSDGAAKEDRVPLAWTSFATPMAPDATTFGFKWNEELVTKTKSQDGGSLVTLPEYFHRTIKDNKKPEWVVVQPKDVPAETGLSERRFGRPNAAPADAYVTPDDADSCWKKPGPVVGPFQVRPNDGSVVTYSWYRFADQPAILNADLTDAEREALQARVEKLHRHWKKDRDYLPPPTLGTLAEIEPALIVTPPPGLEVGYVPIVTRQEAVPTVERN